MELTTHIEVLDEYDEMVAQLDAMGVDYLNPKAVNAIVASLGAGKPDSSQPKKKQKKIQTSLLFVLFFLLNLPIVLGWKVGLKHKVWEPEFTATFRFAFALFAVPVFYLVLGLWLAMLLNAQTAMMVVLCHFLLNWAYVKLA
jgi:hypothetical protein